LVITTGVLSAAVAAALVVLVQVVLAGASNQALDRVLTDRAEAVISSADATSDGDRLAVPDALLDPGVVVYDASGAPVAGTAPPALRTVFDGMAAATGDQRVDDAAGYAVLARSFEVTSGARGVVVVAERVAPYERDERAALAVSIAAGATLVLLAAALTAWTTRRALAPVRAMALTAEEWSEHALDRRFLLGPPTDEIRALGHTLDGLLDKVAHAIRTEQRLTSELAHELRTPLTAILANAELVAAQPGLDAQGREDVAEIAAACRSMADTIAVLVDLAREQGRPDPSIEGTGRQIADGLTQQFARQPGLRVALPSGLRVWASTTVVLRALTPIVENALRLADNVAVTAVARGAVVDLVVQDDGPGVDRMLLPRLFEPGASVGGSGLGLALARRVARSAGGDVTYQADPGPGATFVLSLPAPAESSSASEGVES
jgi:signal transduction histidine kinase